MALSSWIFNQQVPKPRLQHNLAEIISAEDQVCGPKHNRKLRDRSGI